MTTRSTKPDSAVTPRSVVVLAALVLVPGVVYVLGVLLPYLASGPDPVGSGWLGLLGMFSLFLAPLGALVALVGCAVQVRAAFPRAARPVSPGVLAGLVAVALVCVVEVAWFLSPVGRALTAWYLD